MATQVQEYVLTKFMLAIETLATSPRQIQERLYYAMMALIMIGPEDIPDELLDAYVDIKTETTARAARADEGTLAATIYSMTDDEAAAMAKRLFDIQQRIAELYYGVE